MTAAREDLPRTMVVVGVCVLSLVACVALAVWQWEQYASTGGTLQNLGYVLQWPVFGLFPAFAFWRLRVLRKREQAANTADQAASDTPEESTSAGQVAGTDPATTPAPATTAGTAARSPAAAAAATRGAAVRRDEPDDELAAYNRYLAELYAQDQRTA